VTTAPIHIRTARRRERDRRATRAAVLAAGVSVAAWLLGVAALPHALLVLTAAVVGAAWPVRSGEEAALRWVGERVGLAYETALESGDRDDPYGLRDAVRVQGRLVVRDLAPPSEPAWWLPAALFAATLWAWGALVGAPWSGAPFATDPGGAVPPAAPPPAGAPPLESPVPADLPDEPPDSAAADAPPREGGDEGEGGAGDGGEGGEGVASERDALERFVENLREREPEPEDAAGEPEAGAGEAARGEETDEPGDPNAPDPGGEGDPSDRRRGEGEEAGEDREADGDQNGAMDDETESGEEGEAGAEGGEAEGEAPGEEGGAPSDGEGSPESAPGDGENDGAAGVDPGEEGGEGGLGPGVEGEAGEPLGGEGATPEALPSIIGPGPETPVGGVQLPGSEGDGVLPSGAAGAAYQRAVEEALTDGDVPVPYQEVIRRYFQ
jgi:hypothetical protein